MSFYVYRRYDVFAAAETVYAQAPTDAAAYQQLRPDADSFSPDVERTFIETTSLSTNLGANANVVGAPKATLKLDMPVATGTAYTTTGSQATPPNDLDRLLGSCLGGLSKDCGALCTAGTTSSLTVSAEAASKLTPGGLVLVDADANGKTTPRWLGPLTGDGVTYPIATCWRGGGDWNLPTAAHERSQLFAATHYTPTSAVRQSLSVEISGTVQGGKRPLWRLSGLVGNAKLTDATAGKRLSLSFDFKGDRYTRQESASRIDVAQGAVAAPTTPSPLKALGAELRVNGRALPYRQFSVDLGNEFAEIADASATTGRAGYCLTARSPQGSLTTYFDSAILAAYESGDLVDLAFFSGTIGNGLGFHAPTCQWRSLKETEINGLLALELGFAVLQSDVAGIPDFTLSLMGTRA